MPITKRQFLKTSLAGGVLLNTRESLAREPCESRLKGTRENAPLGSLDEQTRVLLDSMGSASPINKLSIAEARKNIRKSSLSSGLPPVEVYSVEDRNIPGPIGPIPVRIYTPGPVRKGKHYPILVYYHGGGFILGSIDTHDSIARFLCKNAGTVVVNVGYRLAPEHQFPVGIEDAYAALQWSSKNAHSIGGNAEKLVVIGDSAGGSMAAVVCQMAKARCGPDIACQVLLYPTVTSVADADYPSKKLFGNGEYFLTKEYRKWRRGLYFGSPDRQQYDLRASPLLAEDLSGLPEALIITAGFDMLRDEAKHYATRLIDSLVSTEYRNYPTTIHGFVSFAGVLDVGKDALNYVSERLKLMFL